MLVRTQFLARRTRAGRQTVAFRMTDPDDTSVQRTVSIERDQYDEMGQPEVVTVTIEPGDHLN
jgi:hypothetical protein